MPTFDLVMIQAEVQVTGDVTNVLDGGAVTVKEALELPNDGLSTIATPATPASAGTTFYKAHSTGLLISLDGGDPEPIPPGFLITSAKIYAQSLLGNSYPGHPLSWIEEWYFKGSFFSVNPSENTEPFLGGWSSTSLSLSNFIAVCSYGWKVTFPGGGDDSGGQQIDYITIRGDYLLWSTSLSINPPSEIIPNVTEVTITDGESLLNTVDELVTEYLDTDGETIISDTIEAVDFISQSAEEIVFIIEEVLPGDIPDCTDITVSLVDNLGQKVYIGTLKTECSDPDIEVPDEPGEVDPDPPFPPNAGTLLGLGQGGINFGGSAFENDFNIIWPEIDGGLDFGGSVTDSLSIMGDISGIYTLIPGQTHDRLYDRLPEQTFIDVKIPDPFIKTGFIKK